VVVWVIAVAACCARAALTGPHRCVFPTFWSAAQLWLAGAELYWKPGEIYRYGPVVTVLLVPFGLLPYAAGVVAWQLTNVAVLGAGLWSWCRRVLPADVGPRQLAAFFLLVLPLTAANINNGQSNCLLLGLMLLGVAAVVAERWNAAALYLTLACLLKLYPVALLLLLAGLTPRRLGWRCGGLVALGLVLPFCFQQPAYVAAQYHSWLALLRLDDRAQLPIEVMCRDIRLPLRAAGWLIPNAMYLALQAVTGAALLGLGLLARRRGWERPRLYRWLFDLACCWMTVCGTATEACTYALVAPALAWGLAAPRHGRVGWLTTGLLVASAALLTWCQVVGWFPAGNRWHILGLHPLAGLLLTAALLLPELPGLLARTNAGPVAATHLVACRVSSAPPRVAAGLPTDVLCRGPARVYTWREENPTSTRELPP
jgi:hypothetical protein